ncbi:histidinol dehydrogenase [Niastella koreensis]|uniref:Histidinol dehydrogenase n=2 Tax=Niastella koreensis TaxID=354356 RepID=G8TJK5_NIAKG|nr:histidinol dehydrogenase [Niastella koreensis]AEW00752.1 histidinol dehydrogenase [Niastella koreensis GR20-10]OQP42372.1 histidinol dehydrogenase [Niastella koreensis]
MQVYQYPERNNWKALLQRPVMNNTALEGSVKNILQEVKQQGDAAVKKFTRQFDKAAISNMVVSEDEFNTAQEQLDAKLKAAILSAKVNIETFHKTQLTAPEVIETMPGVQCWRKSVGIEKVGLYIPGGTAPLFSTILMLGVPAKLAGCKEIILCSPPDANGQLNPAILFAAKAVGITKVFKVGGVQAIGAMAYGTETIPAVSKIFGPGNQYVTCAKQLVQQDGLAIDMPAGPSEVAVYADESAHAAFVAADLLSQAEHGSDSQVVLVSCSQAVINSIEQEINKQVEALPRKDIAGKALANSKLILVNNEAEAIDLLNEYAPEHLIICCNNPMPIAEQIINAGSVFLGHYSPESVGDYASGTNHTLPTNGYAKAYSGVSVDSFVKKITFQQLTQEGLQNISKTVIAMAEAEGLQAHANAVKVRL